ncbi:MAG: hypothetical protein QW587_04680 [Candidatus Bathyarchaeia archaeon]
MAKKADKLKQAVLKNVVQPLLLRFLQPFTAESLQASFERGDDWGQLLKGSSQGLATLSYFRELLLPIPRGWVHAVKKEASDARWINEVLENAIQHERPDLYVHVAFNPKMREFIIENVKQALAVIFEGY